MPYCPNCGKKVEEGQKFCPNCGAKIEITEVVKRETKPFLPEKISPLKKFLNQIEGISISKLVVGWLTISLIIYIVFVGFDIIIMGLPFNLFGFLLVVEFPLAIGMIVIGKSKLKYRKSVALISAVLILVFIILSQYPESNLYKIIRGSPKETDISVIGFKWEARDNHLRPPINYRPINSRGGDPNPLEGTGYLEVELKRDNLYVGIFDKSTAARGSLFLEKSGIHRVPITVPLSDLQTPLELKICLSYFSPMAPFEKGVTCFDKSFPLPKIKINVVPTSLHFTFTEKYSSQTESITIENQGEIPIPIRIHLPESDGTEPNYVTSLKCSILLDGYYVLRPNEHLYCPITSRVTDLPKMTYTATGYVYTLGDNVENALIRKEFTLITEVS